MDEQLQILNEIGRIAQSRYNQNLYFGAGSYAGSLVLLKDGLQFRPNLEKNDNDYWIDLKDDKLNRIANYFEYGTGLFNTRGKKAMIKVGKGKLMTFLNKKGQLIHVKEVKGVRPIFMMTKAVKSVRNERKLIEIKILRKLGYQK